MGEAGRRAKAVLRAAGEMVWPSRTLIDGRRDLGGPGLAAEEWAQLDFLTPPICHRCALPLEIDLGPEGECAACLARPPRWQRARAALVYNDAARRPILDLKHSGRRDGLQLMAGWMVQASGPLLDDAELIVPVPLHYRRLARRGYNQAGWLAEALAKRSGVPLRIDLLKRVRATPSQAGRSVRARRRNVAGAFALRRGKRAALAGKRVLLVDDVLTTGATLNGCARILNQGGASAVDVLVLARVVRGRDISI